MERHRDSGYLVLGGVSMIADDMITFIGNDLVTFGLGVLIFLVVMLTIIFRSARWVALPLASCFHAGLSMVGLLGLMGWQVTVISSNFISLMLILTRALPIKVTILLISSSSIDYQWRQNSVAPVASWRQRSVPESRSVVREAVRCHGRFRYCRGARVRS